MSSVISLLSYKKQAEHAVLILAGLHGSTADGALRDVLANCAATLVTARSARIQVAFVRYLPEPASLSEPPSYPAWIKGFEPRRDDMVFDVSQPSCYSNPEFSRTMDYSNGNFAMAGLFAESTCLSTAVDAYHRGHRFIYLSDASSSRNNGVIPLPQFHEAVSQTISVYGTVMKTTQWAFALTSNRKAR